MRAIRTVPDPALRQIARPVHRYNDVLRRLADEMFSICEASGGVGLAAPQIGISSEIIVVRYQEHRLALCNPFPVAYSGVDVLAEGCLSIPGAEVLVPRAMHLTVAYCALDGEAFTVTAEGIFARILQHEMDHLDGILITDYEQTTHFLTSQTPAVRRGGDVQSPDRRYAGSVH